VPVSLSISVFNDNPEHPGGAVVTARDMTDKAGLAGRLERTVEELERRNSYIDDFRSGVLHMIRDLDRSERELEETCARLRETQAQLVQSSKLTALGELSAGLAHELNQPLTVIKGLVGKILKERAEGPGGDDTDKLRLIAGASSRMEEIANHLRVFARSEAGHLESVDLNRVIRDAFLMMGEYFHKHSIEVELDLGLVARIKGSPTRLEQVVINLATNARDAMPGGGTLTVRTRTVSAGGETRVEAVVADTGKGMDREAAGRIFTPFFTTKPAGKGTGLGLSISRNIVKEHGGDISVESEPGHGTAFTLTFPSPPTPPPQNPG
jgi:signal transduction histidine kinase